MTYWTSISLDTPVYQDRPVVNVPLPGDQPLTANARRCVCGRPLTDPASQARGLGPVCYRRLRGTSPRRSVAPAASTAPVPAIEGQAELPLTDHPVLWSL